MTELGDFFYRLNHELHPRRPDIIEKDYHLHRLLHAISHNTYMTDSLVFKGGTCLVKAHTSHYRFSEDIDFTWKDQMRWQDLTPSQVKKQCSKEIDNLIEQLVTIAEELGLDFNGEKSNPDQVIIGGGGRMPRFYLTYHSEIMNRPAKIKMEINYVDKPLYPYLARELKSYIAILDNKELQLLYRKPYRNYTTPITIECYDPREIFTEKARAALTRIKYKLRDIIDIYMLQLQYAYTIPKYKPQIIEKTRFILDLYHKYQETIKTKTLPQTEDIIEGELQLLTIEPPPDLNQNIQRIHKEIEDIRKELMPL